ncbi:S-adenosyl-L-methionine-dependent methyltransferase [Hypoxylon rubiginosum]|uniref:S-adenosyl-L-methionine-dependent methyltransferase n=1 Tax=Hypoxylon rubiginosum TaxID=110542 RepID=A0ACC0D0W4_9PEZI|nr:S-adenosyl-L-methionine-dependent methyltransferase [Hypoxylon rubiginosum]
MELDVDTSELKPSSISGHPTDRPPPTSNSTNNVSLFGSSPVYTYHDPIPTIEDSTDSFGHDLSLTQETVVSLVPETIRDTSYPSDPEYQPYEGRLTAPDIRSKDAPGERHITVQIPKSTLTQPRSRYDGFIPPATESREKDAVAALLEVAKSQLFLEDGHIEFDLDEFAVYFQSTLYPYQLQPLQHLAARRRSVDCFYFDGVISCGEKRFFLRKIPFRQLPIGNYGVEEHTVGDQIWIRSKFNELQQNEIYYKLKSPSTEYARFWQPFQWIADLAKHVLDYCDHLKGLGRRAVLDDFKSRFSIWLLQEYLGSAVVKRWHSANRSNDFRNALLVNIHFIWKEAYGLDSAITSWHSLWKEAKDLEKYEPNIEFNEAPLDMRSTEGAVMKPRKDGQVIPTVVTPYIHGLFSHMPFENVLQQVTPSNATMNRQSALIQSTQPVQQHSPPAVKRNGRGINRKTFIASIEPGDVISTKPDDDNTDTLWERAESVHHGGEHLWFGLVQKVHRYPKSRYFDVIWLYQSIDTPCGIMKYPWNNELFLSNNCTCHHGTAKIEAGQILSTHSVEWFGSPSTTSEYFVRQTYLSDECKWTTMKKEHMICAEGRDSRELPYKVGDAVLVETDPKALQLDPFIVDAFFDEGKKHYVRLRKLARRRDIDKAAPNAPPNEVVYTERLFEIITRSISRHCLLKAFKPGEKIPTPYDYGGTGDAFFMTHQEIIMEGGESIFVPLDMNVLGHVRQSFDPARPLETPVLRGLDLYCGGGNFGRGLEDGGAVEMNWANDIWREAIHTYMANSKPDTCTPFFGSVDDLLLRAMMGEDSSVPKPGDVDFISAGSPCPGFSKLTPDKTTVDQRKNQSLIASFASFIDLYRPHYGLLENVPAMVNTKPFRDACVFSQLVCALVGMNYQVQVMFLDAWSFGAPTTRSRVFLCFSAPGFRMPKVPRSSHSHPAGTKLTKLGEMSCGRPFDSRKLVPTPFKFVSAREATKDLPALQDGKPDFCVGFPDHRLSMGLTPHIRQQLFWIPTQPWAMNFSKAWYGRPGMPPVMEKSERLLYPPDPTLRVQKFSKAWNRMHPNYLFGTIASRCNPGDARLSPLIHWYEHRPMSILEARRAQGYRDHEVLMGTSLSQWRIIGNSVNRQVSVALGLAIREAWFGTLFDEPHLPQTGLAAVANEQAFEVGSIPPPDRSIFVRDSQEDLPGIRDAELSKSNTPFDTFGDSFLASTPPKTISTPATTDSNGVSDRENGRKRPLDWYVEILAKKPRAEHHDELSVGELEGATTGLML